MALFPFHDRASRSSQPSSRRISQAPRNPLRPATPRGILRSHLAATPLATPAKRRAIFINQSDHHNQSKTPISPRLLNPTRSLRINQQGVRFAHVRFELPPLDLMVPPRGPVQGFCCGARLARVEAPAKEGWGCTPYPAFRARSLPPPHSAAERVTCHQPVCAAYSSSLSKRQVSGALLSASLPSDACGRARYVRTWRSQ